MPSKESQCLGDGVYAAIDQYGELVLTTGSHERSEADNVIVLEYNVLQALLDYVHT